MSAREPGGKPPIWRDARASRVCDLAHRHVANLSPARLAARPLNIQIYGVFAGLLVPMNRMLLRRASAVAEIPAPGSDLARGFVLKSQQAAIHVEDLE